MKLVLYSYSIRDQNNTNIPYRDGARAFGRCLALACGCGDTFG